MACELLGVSTSGYFEHWRRKGANKPSKADTNKRIGSEALLAHIRAIHAEVKQEYGWPKMWKELVARGVRVGKERVRRMMKAHGINARGKRKFVVTIDSMTCRLRQTCCSATSRRLRPIRCGWVTSPTSPLTRAGCNWPWYWTCTAVRWWAGACSRTCKVHW